MAQEWTLDGTRLQPVPRNAHAARQAAVTTTPRSHSDQSSSAQASEASGSGLGAEPQVDFRAMKQEVNAFGAVHLERKRDKQSFEDRTLQALGFTATKGPRIGAKMGLGMARKAHERERQEEEELAAANMLQLKGRGKRRAAQRKGDMQRGLNEARGFTPGLMRVRKPAGKRNRQDDGASMQKRPKGAGPGKGRGIRRQ